MPTPARTSTDAIVAAARALLEQQGLTAVTMQGVAQAVGVRAPSLYKRIGGHGDLMHRVANDVAAELATVLETAAHTGEPEQDLPRIAHAFRAWAVRSPHAYSLLTSSVPEAWRADRELNARVSAGILAATGELVGPTLALDAARTFVSFVHGFVNLELAGAFRLGGDPATAYEYGIRTLVAGIAAQRPGPAAQ